MIVYDILCVGVFLLSTNDRHARTFYKKCIGRFFVTQESLFKRILCNFPAKKRQNMFAPVFVPILAPVCMWFDYGVLNDFLKEGHQRYIPGSGYATLHIPARYIRSEYCSVQ